MIGAVFEHFDYSGAVCRRRRRGKRGPSSDICQGRLLTCPSLPLHYKQRYFCE